MENKMQIFENAEFGQMRTVEVNGEIYFVAKDVAEILGYIDTYGAVRKHVDEEDKLVCQIDSAGQKRDVTIINESGLYSLILSSKLPKAKEFKHWVTSEVLPSIRKHGAYMTPATIENIIANPDFGIELLMNLKSEREKRIAAEKTIEEQKPKVLFSDAVETSHTSILVGDLAKLLKQNGVEIGANRLFEWLRNNGYLIKGERADKNMPTQKSMEMNLFEVKERTINNPDGSVRITRTPKVTGKGQIYFVDKLIKKFVA